jgi:hypothetical protein
LTIKTVECSPLIFDFDAVFALHGEQALARKKSCFLRTEVDIILLHGKKQ